MGTLKNLHTCSAETTSPFAGKIPNMFNEGDACILQQFVICLILNGFSEFKYHKNGETLFYKSVLCVVDYH